MRADTKPMSFAELAAKRVLESVLSGTTLEFRQEQSHGEYDFDLRYPDGTLAAVEVTRSMVPSQMQTSAAIHNKKNKPVVDATKCKNAWTIIPTPNANIAAIRENVDEYLSALEEAGLKEFSAFAAFNSKQLREAGLGEVFPDAIVPRCVERICDDLGIQGGSVISSEGPPKIMLGHPIYGGAFNSDSAIQAGRLEYQKDDNRKKLDAANTKERHLVVYIDVTNGTPWTALTELDPPAAIPDLPREISHVWLVGDMGQADKFIVWRASTADIWLKSEVNVV